MSFTPEMLANLKEINARLQHERDQEIAENKCRRCGGSLFAFWKDGVRDRGEPSFLCPRCESGGEG